MAIPNKYDFLHSKSLDKYTQEIRKAYLECIKEVSILAENATLNVQGEFFFRNNPILSKKVDKLLKQLYSRIYGTTVLGIQTEWDRATEKMNELANKLYGKETLEKVPAALRNKILSGNSGARLQFLRRKEAGLNLSERVWKLTQPFKQQLELGLELGIGSGKSASDIATEIKSFLNEPEKLFRRVRENQQEINKVLKEIKKLKEAKASQSEIDKLLKQVSDLKKAGRLRLSKAAKIYHPGRGISRSSYKNAVRLVRNEINFSYEASNLEKRKQQEFVVGIEIKVSPNHNPMDDMGGISCIDLQGKYPKDYDFTYKWHVNCKCQSYDILKTEDEIDEE